MQEVFAIPILYVLHSSAEITALCVIVMILKQGHIVRHWTPKEIFTAHTILVLKLIET